MTPGYRLKEFCKDRNLSQLRLAEILEMPQQSVSRYFSNKSIPETKVLVKLSDLGCDINWLLTGQSAKVENSINNSSVTAENGGMQTIQGGYLFADNNSDVYKELVTTLKRVISDQDEKIKEQAEKIKALEEMLKTKK